MQKSIPEFYSGKNIFVTGATGFLGKALVIKLLKSCPDISSIYCLIREKKGQSAENRLDNILKDACFDVLRKDFAEYRRKLFIIAGDVQLDNLGISEENREMLSKKIHIVFHSAATVRFDEVLRDAISLNLLAVRKMVQLCKTFKNLESLVHVSTAYSNCDQPYIEEVVYPWNMKPQNLIELSEWLDNDALQLITVKLLRDKPNTYTYTKHLAEILLMDEAADLPLAIVRPSIITGAWKEPIPGWLDNSNGPNGMYIAAGKGVLRSMIGKHHFVADIIPVDLPVNMMIAVAWYRAMGTKTNTDSIYHSTTGGLNPFTWGEMESNVLSYYKSNPLNSCYRRPRKGILTTNSFLHDCWLLVSHMIPAYAADLAFILIGKSPRMVKMYNKLHRAMKMVEYFTMRSWQWTNTNQEELKSQMNAEDQAVFYFDPRLFHWPTYMQNYCLGVKKFILKEDPASLPAAKARLKMLRNIVYAFNTTFLVLALRILIAKSSLARNIWFFVLGLVFKFVRFFRLTSTVNVSSN